ncbi:MAG: hypothetical protein LBP62_03690 [Clostridiales bacterium]|jgi:ABC-type multidrug transport system ATPase subunit|nr:hypothetical protein [Clostridiales bacterium]
MKPKKLKELKSLTIKNVRGIKELELEFKLTPNIPIFFVASNGAGKTSIATAFSSLIRKKSIKLTHTKKKSDYYEENPDNSPKIVLEDNDKNTYIADDKTNTISKSFGIYVLTQGIKIKGTYATAGGYRTIPPIKLVSNINECQNYDTVKSEIYKNIEDLNTTWCGIEKEEKDNTLYAYLPNPDKISNGERDVLIFYAKLLEAEQELTKKQNILIIDEIFDYLDEANIIAAQYFLTKMLEKYKKDKKLQLFLIILTHLSPDSFKSYMFPTRTIVYLNQQKHGDTYGINKLLRDRGKCDKKIKDLIDKYYLHYYPDNPLAVEKNQLDKYLKTLLKIDIVNRDDFYNMAKTELRKYLDDTKYNYNVAFVCCGLRIELEEKIYMSLKSEDQKEYLDKHKTKEKFDFARKKNIDVPDAYYLLGIIYNEALHLDDQCEKLIPIGDKLANKVIKNIISKCV